MQPPQAPRIYEFGEFELDSQRRVLSSRITGQPVDITGRVIDALCYFVERPGQLVEKKALMDALWPHVVVEEGNLTQTIHTLRRVLGEKAGEHRYIATVPGRGYRFVAEVRGRGTEVEEPPRSDASESASSLAAPVDVSVTREVPTPRPPSRFWWGAVAVIVVGLATALGLLGRKPAPVIAAPPAAAPASIAVLPFVDLSPSQDQVPFAEGLSEEILSLLARADELRVIARTSSFSFKEQNADIHTIAERLSVTHVLEGSVRKAGDRVRVTAQLIDGATSAHVWSDTFDRDLDDIFGVQREIATAVADALHVTLRSVPPTRAETRRTQAYEHFLQGRHLFHRRSETDLLQAKTHFEKAVEIDPEYGRAWAALAGVYRVAPHEGHDLPDAMRKWSVAVERATTLSPDLAEGHVRAAQYYFRIGDPKAAEAHLKRATLLDPQDPLLLGMSLIKRMSEGRIEEVIAIQTKLVAADPLSASNRGNLGVFLTLSGRYEEAQRELERSLELSPASAHTMAGIADVLILQGRMDEAITVASRMPTGYVRDQRIALARFLQGDVRGGEAMLATVHEHAKSESDFKVAMAIAEIHAMRGDVDGAFTWLDDARRRAERQHGVTAPWIFLDDLLLSPYLRSLQKDARWQAYQLPKGYDDGFDK
jgi:TolB-like protein/DNA-binding winged helix-turn-helix (wHTH) protein/thioredoxin-like negative regulator of GroEL